MTLPSCGLYKTTTEIAGVPAGRLVYFHNHGEPGPGIYLPEAWQLNRAQFSKQGRTLEQPNDADSLSPLPTEGLYRVSEPFTCCEKKCREFPEGMLVQLGYNAAAQPILFVPTQSSTGLSFPERGSRIESDRFAMLQPIKVAQPVPAQPHEERPSLH